MRKAAALGNLAAYKIVENIPDWGILLAQAQAATLSSPLGIYSSFRLEEWKTQAENVLYINALDLTDKEREIV